MKQAREGLDSLFWPELRDSRNRDQGIIQTSAKRLVRGCEKFVPALAYLFCLAQPGPAMVLLSKICIPFSRSLYIEDSIPTESMNEHNEQIYRATHLL